MVEIAITECEVDGFVSLCSYNHDGCACEYCSNQACRVYLKHHYSFREILSQFGIDDVAEFRLDGKLG